jgi:hypothetical protein
MWSLFDVSFGIGVQWRAWIGIQVICEVDTSIADRNADVALPGRKKQGKDPLYDIGGPPRRSDLEGTPPALR